MYTVWDAYAIGLLDLSPVSYFWGAELCRTALLAPLALPRSLALRRVRRDERRIVLGVGRRAAGAGGDRRGRWHRPAGVDVRLRSGANTSGACGPPVGGSL
jgi:hypothetical protein